jgi:hypothetical protein
MLPRVRVFAIATLRLCAGVCAQAPASGTAKPVEVTVWRTGLIEINDGWSEHDGDNLAWAAANFDDSGWQQVDLEDMGAAQRGSRWYRRHANFGPDHPEVQFLVQGGDGTYELYVNGQRMSGAELRSSFNVTRPTERVFSLSSDNGDFVLALRTRTPESYAVYHLPLFLSVTMGGPTAIGYERQALESERLYSAVPSIAINLLICLAGIGTLALFANQRSHREYLYLGLYLFLLGLSNGLWIPQQAGVLPTSFNILVADPLTYIFTILQIEFTFSFAGKRPGRGWRAYEGVLLAPLILVAICWLGYYSATFYILVEAMVQAPVAILLPVLLFVWYRGGNREAGWLILPSLLPSAMGTLYDLGTFSIFFGWHGLSFLDNPIPLGPIPLHATDLGALLFLLAIGIVMFFRFTRISRDQARTAAELDAAREIQRRLVPASLPTIPGYAIEAAYLPANEVGGDFYQFVMQPNGNSLIIMADVSGKGLKAAMTGALAIGALRTLTSEGLSPSAFLTRLNRELVQAQDGGFITCFCARVEAGGTVTLSNAGHLSPYLNGEEVETDSALPLGISLEAQYAECFIELKANDRLTLLSDGVVEARNAAGELFGFARTRDVSRQSAQSIAAVAQHFGQDDDITVLTLTRAGASGSAASAS